MVSAQSFLLLISILFGQPELGLRAGNRNPKSRDAPPQAGWEKSFTAAGRPCTLPGVSGQVVENGQVNAPPRASEFDSFTLPALEAAIARSQDFLLREQKPEGYWIGELLVDGTLVADRVAYHHWNRSVDEKWQRKAVNQLLSLQLPGGGWSIYPGGPPEVNATVKAYLALKLAGVPTTDPRLLRARQTALSLGGVPRLNTFSKLYLALMGLFPWEYLPTIPCEIILLGKWFGVYFYDMSSWSRAMLVPLSILNHCKPTRHLGPNSTLKELYPLGFHERDLLLARDPHRFTWRNFFLWLDSVHKFAELFARHHIHPFRKRALKKALEWMIARSEGSDGLAAIFPGILNSLIVLKALGYPPAHPLVRRCESELKKLEHETEHSVRIEPCKSPVWDTAIVAIALHESGLSSDHPALVRACDWLIEREVRFRGDWQYKNPGERRAERLGLRVQQQVEPGRGRHRHGAAGLAQNSHRRIRGGATAPSARPQLDAHLSMPRRRLGLLRQGLHQEHPGEGARLPITTPCSTPNAPTSRRASSNCSATRTSARSTRRSAKALEFIRPHQEEDGSVVRPLGRQLYLRHLAGPARPPRPGPRTCARAGSCARATGWRASSARMAAGASVASTYDDPVFKGQGPSTASQSAWAVMGLCAFDDPRRPSVQNGIEYLLRTQNTDGTWTEAEATGTGFPRVFYLKYDMYPQQLAVAGTGHLPQSAAARCAVAESSPPKPRRPGGVEPAPLLAGSRLPPRVSWFYRNLIRPVLFAQEAEKIHDRVMRLLTLMSREKILLETCQGLLWRARIARRAFRPALSQPGRPGRGHGQMGLRPPGLGRLGFWFQRTGGRHLARPARQSRPAPLPRHGRGGGRQ